MISTQALTHVQADAVQSKQITKINTLVETQEAPALQDNRDNQLIQHIQNSLLQGIHVLHQNFNSSKEWKVPVIRTQNHHNIHDQEAEAVGNSQHQSSTINSILVLTKVLHQENQDHQDPHKELHLHQWLKS